MIPRKSPMSGRDHTRNQGLERAVQCEAKRWRADALINSARTVYALIWAEGIAFACKSRETPSAIKSAPATASEHALTRAPGDFIFSKTTPRKVARLRDATLLRYKNTSQPDPECFLKW
jgi:hypothetical protein